jgi:hypothetical protein
MIVLLYGRSGHSLYKMIKDVISKSPQIVALMLAELSALSIFYYYSFSRKMLPFALVRIEPLLNHTNVL